MFDMSSLFPPATREKELMWLNPAHLHDGPMYSRTLPFIWWDFVKMKVTGLAAIDGAISFLILCCCFGPVPAEMILWVGFIGAYFKLFGLFLHQQQQPLRESCVSSLVQKIINR